MSKTAIFYMVLYSICFLEERGKLICTIYCFLENYIFKGINNRPLPSKRSVDLRETLREAVGGLANSPLCHRRTKKLKNSFFESLDGASSKIFNAGFCEEIVI